MESVGLGRVQNDYKAKVFWMFGYEGMFAPVQFVLTSYYCCCPVEGLLVLIFDMSLLF